MKIVMIYPMLSTNLPWSSFDLYVSDSKKKKLSRLNFDDPILLSVVFRCGLVEDLAQTGELFDGVVASEVIEHVADPITFIACCSNLVKVSRSPILL